VLLFQIRAFYTISKLEKFEIVVILARFRSEVKYEKSEIAILMAVAVAVSAVIKEQRATALFPVGQFIAHLSNS